MRLAAFLLVAMAVGAGALTATHAQPPAGAPRVCAPTNSEKATVAAIAADPAAWMGKCVSIEAIYSGERLNVDADAIYGVNGNSIGGYVDGKGDVGGAWTGTFTGRVADCAVAEEDLLTGLLRSPGISLHGRTLGCLEPKGPFLVFMTHAGMKEAAIKRRLPGAKGGDLKLAADDWRHREAAISMAVRFGMAMASEDIGMLRDVLGNGYVAERLFAGEGGALSALRGGGEHQMAVFADRDETADRAAGEICWCLKRECSKVWPIDSRDADNQKSRPYACLRFEGSLTERGWRYRYDASHDVYGLDEP